MGGRGSGGWNKSKAIDYTNLKRYCAAYLLNLMRKKPENSEQEHEKFRVALELTGKDIGRTKIDQSTSNNLIITQDDLKTLRRISDRISNRLGEPAADAER